MHHLHLWEKKNLVRKYLHKTTASLASSSVTIELVTGVPPYLANVAVCWSVDDLIYHAVINVHPSRRKPANVQLSLMTRAAHCHIFRRVQKNCQTDRRGIVCEDFGTVSLTQ